MKVLVIAHKATKASSPHFLKPEHRKTIQKAIGKQALLSVVASEDDLLREAIDADVIAGFPWGIPSGKQAPRLKWINLFSAGADRVLTPELIRSKVVVTNSSGIHATPIAEHIIGFMLLFTRGFYRTFKNQLSHRWEKDETVGELRGKEVLIVGLGNIGTEAARLAHAFGARVTAVSNTKKKPAFVGKIGLSKDLDRMLGSADFVVICLPHTPETHHLFNMKKFVRMKDTAILINIGRGGIVNEKELIEALRKKRIGGAGLDVTEQEPLPASSPLWDMENVAITPHHSGLSEKYMDRAIELFCENLKLYLAEKPLLNVVNKKKGY